MLGRRSAVLADWKPRQEESIFDDLGYQLPSENWHTNCLAFFLKLDTNLRNQIVADLTGLSLGEVSKMQNLTVNLYPMLPENNRIADIVVRDSKAKFFVLIENKIDSPVDPGQIDSYLRCQIGPLKAKGWRAHLVLLTQQDESEKVAKFEKKVKENLRHLRWLDVYRTLAGFKSRDKHVNLLITAFLRHLKLKGMAPPRGFGRRYGKSWLQYIDFKTNAHSVLEKVKPRTEAKNPGFVSEGPKEAFLEEVPYLGYYLYFRSIKAQNRDKFQIWLGFAQEKNHPIVVDIELFFYPPVDYYKKVVMQRYGRKLKTWASRLERLGWSVDFAGNIEDAPLWKERPLLEVVGDSRKFEEQCQAVQGFFTAALTELSRAGTLEFVKETLRRRPS